MVSSKLLFGFLIGRLISFDVDWAVFRGSGGSNRIEFAYGIPYAQLTYAGGEEPEAEFTVGVEMLGVGNDFSESGSFRRRARIGSFRAAEAGGRMIVDQFSMTALPGRYAFVLTISDSTGRGIYRDTVEVEDFRESPVISGLQLGIDCVTDSLGRGFAVVPNPGRRFRQVSGNVQVRRESGVEADRIYFYFEAYNLDTRTESCEVRCRLVRQRSTGEPDTVVRSPVLRRRQSGGAMAAALGMSIAGLDTGRYELAVIVQDGSGRAAVRTAEFRVVPAEVPVAQDAGRGQRLSGLSQTEQQYYRDLRLIATPAELSYYNSLSDSGKEAFLVRFWQRHDLTEYARRMAAADRRYSTAVRSGVQTDRGRVLVTYGEPDEIEQRVMEMESRPREYWQYYRLGYVFVFADIRNDGNYRLVYTNCPTEPPTGLTHYLTPEEQERFR